MLSAPRECTVPSRTNMKSPTCESRNSSSSSTRPAAAASLNRSGEIPLFSPAMKRDLTPQLSRYHASFLRGRPYFFSEAPLGCTCSESLWRASSSLTIIGKSLSGRQPGPIMSAGYFSIARLSVHPPNSPPEISDDALGESQISRDSPILSPFGIALPKSVLKERPPQMRSSYMGLNFRRSMLMPFLRGRPKPRRP